MSGVLRMATELSAYKDIDLADQDMKMNLRKRLMIEKGESPMLKTRRNLVIKENMSKNNYCMECAALILQKAQEDLSQLTNELEGEC